MRALVISGGGSKGAFAGGVAQYLIEELKHDYQLLMGTSTGSLLVPHLALNKLDKLKSVYTSVNNKDIFDVCPFVIKQKQGVEFIAINHFNVLMNFIRGSKTFGESNNLRKLIREKFTEEEFNLLKNSAKEVVITVSNLTYNQVEYKALKDFNYDEFCDWIWISCNYTPFMSLVKRNECEYADGGLGNMIPIEEAIKRGATVVDAIILQTKVKQTKAHSRNPFALMTNMFAFMLDRIEHQNIRIGKFAANKHEAIINFYFIPSVLTTNSLIFDEKKMTEWWKIGFDFAKSKNQNSSSLDV